MRPSVVASIVVAVIGIAGCLQEKRDTQRRDDATRIGNLAFLVDATYPAGTNATVRLENRGDLVHKYTHVAAADIEFTDSSGRSFKPPEATPLTMQNGERIGPGEIKVLFTWHGLSECTRNDGSRGACSESRPLEPGVYYISAFYPIVDDGHDSQRRGAWANASFEVS